MHAIYTQPKQENIESFGLSEVFRQYIKPICLRTLNSNISLHQYNSLLTSVVFITIITQYRVKICAMLANVKSVISRSAPITVRIRQTICARMLTSEKQQNQESMISKLLCNSLNATNVEVTDISRTKFN